MTIHLCISEWYITRPCIIIQGGTLLLVWKFYRADNWLPHSFITTALSLYTTPSLTTSMGIDSVFCHSNVSNMFPEFLWVSSIKFQQIFLVLPPACFLCWLDILIKYIMCTQRRVQPDQCYFTIQIVGINGECSF